MSHVPPTHFVPEGDKPKVERTRRHFAAVFAALKTAEDYGREIERERAADRRALEQAEKALAQTPDYVAGKREALAAVRARLAQEER